MATRPLIVIVGPTASGKSEVALRIAERYDGEIICADSRTIYKGMDIGTAKPSVDDQKRVPHHLLDVAEPDERFTAYDFQQQALAIIGDIRQRGKLPLLVGGTGLYIDGVVYGYSFSTVDIEQRAKLENQTIDQLKSMIKSQRKTLPRNIMNKRHLINTLLRDQPVERKSLPGDTVLVGITTDKLLLHDRIASRARQIFEAGIVEEAERLAAEYGWESEAMTGNIYPIVHELIEGRITKQHAIERFETADWQLAKRQLTWLKRNHDITWLPLSSAEHFISTILDRGEHKTMLR